jgi:hypothetical protein
MAGRRAIAGGSAVENLIARRNLHLSAADWAALRGFSADLWALGISELVTPAALTEGSARRGEFGRHEIQRLIEAHAYSTHSTVQEFHSNRDRQPDFDPQVGETALPSRVCGPKLPACSHA